MQKDDFSLELTVNDKPVYEYLHQGDTYVEGRKSSVFKLRFRNNSAKRVLVIPSVDGLSTLNGKTAGPDSPGIVVKANEILELPGWMVDSAKSAEFVFQDRESSYARSVDANTTNTGVIGALVYAEQEAQPEFYGINPMSRPSFLPSPTSWPTGGIFGWEPNTSSAADRSAWSRRISVGSNLGYTSTATASFIDTTAEQLGVGWGQSVDFNVNSTTFDKGDLLAQLVVFYDSRKNLERRGIVVERRDALSIRPNPFPGIGCKPPAGWKP